jgi:hypothetical protein
VDLRVPATGQSRKTAMFGALDFAARQLVVHTAPTERSADFIVLLKRLSEIYGPRPGGRSKPIVLVLDNRPFHASRATHAASPLAHTGSP